MKSKINNTISELIEQNIISQEVAHRITEYYQTKATSKSKPLFTIFGIFGGALVGLGLILILAHNWDAFSRSIKTLFAFFPLLSGQIISGYAILKKKSSAWKESSGTFLFFAIGAAIALVSQIYNIPSDLSGFLCIWIVLGLPLIYVLNSKAVAMLVIGFATYYACELGYAFNFTDKTPWLYLVMLLATIPFYLKELKRAKSANTTAIFNMLFPLSLIVTLGSFVNSNWSLGFLMYAMLFGVFYNLGKTSFFKELQLRQNSFVLLGSLGTVILFVILSFNDIWYEIQRKIIHLNSQEGVIVTVLFLIALALFIYSKRSSEKSKFNLFQYGFMLFAIVFIIGAEHAALATILSNLILLILGVFAVKIGADTFRFSVLNYGLLIISATIICRFFDTNMSFVLRGVLFVLVGLGFFLSNFIMLKKQKAKHIKTLN